MIRWLLCLLLFATPALAVDGDAWGAYTDISQGQFDCRGHLICSAKVAADSTCAEFNLGTKNAAGFPAFFIVSIILVDPECSGTPEFQLRGSHTASGTKFNIGPQLTQAGTASKEFLLGPKFIDVNLTDDAACNAPGNDVALILCYER